jgi:hypothetical protein
MPAAQPQYFGGKPGQPGPSDSGSVPCFAAKSARAFNNRFALQQPSGIGIDLHYA